MKRGRSGTLERSSVAGAVVEAFVPAPLPPDPPLALDPALLRLLERATLALGKLDGISRLLPDEEIFLYGYVRREALLSSQIEGTQSSFSDLLSHESRAAPGIPDDDVQEVSNYVAALEHGLARLDELPLCGRLLREMHAILLRSGRGARRAPGEYRRSQNWIGGRRPQDALFVPPPPHRVPACMDELERFLNVPERSQPVLVKAALAHVQFETIHPFLDGNGRLGRLLIPLVLHAEGALDRPLLYLSLYFKRHRQRYYQLLDRVRWEGDWEAWLAFFLEGVEQTAQDAVERAHHLLDLFDRDAARIRASLGRRAGSALRIHRALCRRPLLDAQRAAKETALSLPTVRSGLEALERLGIVQEVTGLQRGRRWAYPRYIELLSEETEPLSPA